MTAYVPAVAATAEPSPEDTCVAVVETDVLLVDGRLPRLAEVGEPADICPLGTLDGRPLWAVAVPAVPTGLARRDWSAVVAGQPPDVVRMIARGLQTLTWRAHHRWCGRCRGPLEDLDRHPGRTCPACGVSTFVSPQPVVLVAVVRDGPSGPEVLLVRHTYRDTVSWMLIGGWVDPGEPLEQAAAREAAEEVGLAVTDLRYWGSEAWGLDGPGIVAILFTARPVDPAAEPVPDTDELAEARFFPVVDLPRPRASSHHIAGRFLDALSGSRTVL